VTRVFEDFRYTRTVSDGDDHVAIPQVLRELGLHG
jgi:hypothetical protein